MNEPILDPPCPRCLDLAREGTLRIEMVQPVPPGVGIAPLGPNGIKCCFDCQAADTVMRVIKSIPGWTAARIAVGNDRQEQYRLPGVPMGLVQQKLVRPSKPGDLERHHKWLDRQNWFGIEEEL